MQEKDNLTQFYNEARLNNAIRQEWYKNQLKFDLANYERDGLSEHGYPLYEEISIEDGEKKTPGKYLIVIYEELCGQDKPFYVEDMNNILWFGLEELLSACILGFKYGSNEANLFPVEFKGYIYTPIVMRLDCEVVI